ncbi:heterokaryon incompatibility protein-domain-containing protein [Xylariaceae sp. AK1471]|nr:heterokaryon incompatibility protein-domain-containing protein [Xylariaceae sp. AK1471]
MEADGCPLANKPNPLMQMAGYHGYELFGRALLHAIQQPRHGDLAYNSEAAIFQIKRWVRECILDHPSCSSGGFAPKRLLCLQGGQGQQIARLRVVETWSNFSSPFVALSHCWGKTQHAITTKANYVEHLSYISQNSLPRTFQDAIWITERLGLKYLWIDSLCIIQDDQDDWSREVVNMSHLYGAAYLTLAASHGVFPLVQDNHPILLEDTVTDSEGNIRDVSVILAPALSLNAESPVHQTFSNQKGGHFINFSCGSDQDSWVSEDFLPPQMPSSEPLPSRGWAFQERVLSTRVVHFTRQELVWECKANVYCECGGVRGTSLMASLMGSLKTRMKLACELETEFVTSGTESAAEMHLETEDYISEPEREWEKYVKMYTGMYFTKPKDRAAAFVGIAQTFGNIVCGESNSIIGEFCAVLWSASLPNSLLWSCSTDNFLVLPETNRGRRPKIGRRRPGRGIRSQARVHFSLGSRV